MDGALQMGVKHPKDCSIQLETGKEDANAGNDIVPPTGFLLSDSLSYFFMTSSADISWGAVCFFSSVIVRATSFLQFMIP